MTDLVKWLRGWPAEVEEFGQCADEIERLRWLLREYADVVRLIKEGKPVPLDFLEIRIRHALGDER